MKGIDDRGVRIDREETKLPAEGLCDGLPARRTEVSHLSLQVRHASIIQTLLRWSYNSFWMHYLSAESMRLCSWVWLLLSHASSTWHCLFLWPMNTMMDPLPKFYTSMVRTEGLENKIWKYGRSLATQSTIPVSRLDSWVHFITAIMDCPWPIFTR